MKKLLGLVLILCAAFSLCSYADINNDPATTFAMSGPVTCDTSITNPQFCQCWTDTVYWTCMAREKNQNVCAIAHIVLIVGNSPARITAFCNSQDHGDPACIPGWQSYILGNNQQKKPCGPPWPTPSPKPPGN